ncbi:hypothetical protein B0H15DRAFT_838765 [Mycena belliarum]|uniref:Uncharacterized protein n=1 Tax=Mycena belliarum TaxID=1033014 RepID=A0AAD6XRC7_9AGAR|nr:hypothetical protein B0H15DRAFT_838765 [Mycena belliae]
MFGGCHVVVALFLPPPSHLPSTAAPAAQRIVCCSSNNIKLFSSRRLSRSVPLHPSCINSLQAEQEPFTKLQAVQDSCLRSLNKPFSSLRVQIPKPFKPFLSHVDTQRHPKPPGVQCRPRAPPRPSLHTSPFILSLAWLTICMKAFVPHLASISDTYRLHSYRDSY